MREYNVTFNIKERTIVIDGITYSSSYGSTYRRRLIAMSMEEVLKGHKGEKEGTIGQSQFEALLNTYYNGF